VATFLTGLFLRGSAHYQIRIILPANHPLHGRHRSGKVIRSLLSCGNEAACARARPGVPGSCVLKRQAEHTGNPQFEMLTRAEGYAFHAKLEKLPARHHRSGCCCMARPIDDAPWIANRLKI